MSEVLAIEAPVSEARTETKELAPVTLPFRVLVIGPSGSGKSTLAAALAAELGMAVGETSEYLLTHYTLFKVNEGFHDEETIGAWIAREKDQEKRQALLAFGDVLIGLRPASLLWGAARKGQVLVGARRKVELEAWYQSASNEGDFLIEIVDTTSPDDAYELADFKKPSPGRRYTLDKVQVLEAAAYARELASDILQEAGL